jgi:integrase
MSDPSRRKRRETLTDNMVARLPRKRKRYFFPDPEMPGHGVRVLPDGVSSYYTITRDAFGKQRWVRLGPTAGSKIAESREQARAIIKRLKAGLTPIEPPPVKPDTVADVAQNWLRRHVEAKGLRTAPEMRRVLHRYVLPHWADLAFKDIRRSDIARLLDGIEDKSGAWAADSALSVLRAMATWFAARDDTYTPPFVRGMRRVAPQDRKRDRKLSDHELRKLWKAAEGAGAFGAFLQILLLTAQRRQKVVTMKWDDIAEDGTWTIPTAPREKSTGGVLVLPKLALDIIRAQPRLAGNFYVFAGQGAGPLAGFSERNTSFKSRFGIDGDATLHDLRRTSRSLMARAGVNREHAERVLGHALPGVEGVYNVHDFVPEKAAALAKLAGLIEEIVHGEPGNNVVLFPSAVQP